MDATMVKSLTAPWFKPSFFTQRNKTILIASTVIVGAMFAYFKPQQFTDLWLTRDQQGQILFQLGHYQQASSTFKSTQWQAFSSYGAEQYKNAATLYSQFNDIEHQVAKANALAHGREYIKARNLYQQILTLSPQNTAASTNIVIVQAIIDEVNRLSASQKAEDGEAIKELGDEPQTGDGAEREEAPKEQEIEQLTAAQLLLDPSLNDMWLRQVQKNPANFLTRKFYMQQELINRQANQTNNDANAKNQGADDE
jgi:Ca-activated chloride channel family protein